MSISVGAHTSTSLTANSTSIVTPGVTTQASGSSFLAFIAHENAATVSALNDTFSNPYVKQGATFGGGANASFACEWWLCENGAGGGSHAVTATQSPTNLGAMFFIEIIGGVLSGIVDQTSGWVNDSASPFTATIGTTTNADDLLISCALTGSISGTEVLTWGGTTVLSPLDAKGDANFFTGGTAGLVVSATGAYTASVTSAGAGTAGINMILVAFKAGSGVLPSLSNDFKVSDQVILMPNTRILC